MFTGIIQKTGVVRSVGRVNDGWSLQIGCIPWRSQLETGESIAVHGVCLTVTSYNADSFTTDLLDETREKTVLRRVQTGSRVNLERALAIGDRLGGHLVTGHVDETGTVRDITSRNRDYLLRIGCSAYLAGQSVSKGSITIDGVSLTISGLGDDWIEVNIIPHTWHATTLCEHRVGDNVNLEGDIIGKYIARLMNRSNNSGITQEMLRENGFV
jgi:riboflavin synthase